MDAFENSEAEKASRRAALKRWVRDGVDDPIVVDAVTVRERVLTTIAQASSPGSQSAANDA